jgi:hypothetical protein
MARKIKGRREAIKIIFLVSAAFVLRQKHEARRGCSLGPKKKWPGLGVWGLDPNTDERGL